MIGLLGKDVTQEQPECKGWRGRELAVGRCGWDTWVPVDVLLSEVGSH